MAGTTDTVVADADPVANGAVAETETEETKRTRETNYHSPLPVATLSFHKSIESLPNLTDWLQQWADQSNLVLEVREGGRTGESNRVLYKFDTPETYAIRTAAGASFASRALLNDVKAKAAAQGISVEDLLRAALANL